MDVEASARAILRRAEAASVGTMLRAVLMNVVSIITPPAIESTILDDLLELLWLQDVGETRSRAMATSTGDGRVDFRLGASRFTARIEIDRWCGGNRIRERGS